MGLIRLHNQKGWTMRNKAPAIELVVLSMLILLFTGPTQAGVQRYVEDFTTAQYRDSLNTTADWDTVAGELRLFPFAPTLLGTYDTPGLAKGVAVSGDHAFVADGASGLQVIDISDPASPALLGTYDTPSFAHGVTVSGDYAFVADGTLGLQVIDISNPTAPTFLGTCDTPGNALGLAVSGDYAFVADGTSGLQVIDISDPTSPAILGTYGTPDLALEVTVSGDYAFVADSESGLIVIDISDPANPTHLGTYDTPGVAYAVTVSGDYALVADGTSGLQVIDISDPASPTFLGAYTTTDVALDVAVSGDHAIVTDNASELYVIDISDPANPVPLGTCSTPGHAYGVAVSGDLAFVADALFGFHAVDIADRTNPTLLGTCDTPDLAWNVTTSGDYAFVADYFSGLQVIDISDPANPTLLGNWNTWGQAYDVTVSGDHAFVADYLSGLHIIDISDPTPPTRLGNYDTPGEAYGVTVSGNHAFVADGYDGVHVIDISDPENPDSVGTYDTLGKARGVTVSGDYVFVAGDDYGLQVIDISDPANPTLLGACSTPGRAFGVTVAGDHAFVADYNYGLQVFDISDPTNPIRIGTDDTPGEAYAVTVSGDYAFVADDYFGLWVIDISDPTNPTRLGGYDTPGLARARGVTVSGDYAFVANYDFGLEVIRVFQSEVYWDDNIGQSLPVAASNDTILRTRLTTAQTDSLNWELSADGGTSWQAILPDASWYKINVPGVDLLWRSTLSWVTPGDNPEVTDLQIEWLVAAAVIDSIVDVPDDQGGWVRAYFKRSALDFPDEVPAPILHYGIWQRVDSPALIATVGSVSSMPTEKSVGGDTPYLSGIPSITYQGKTYVQSRLGAAASTFPPGTWTWVATVPAIQQDTYIANIPTAADSATSGANHTVFVMTAHTTTPSVWYVGEPDSGYSLDNIAPAVPTSFAVVYNTGSGNQLSWDPCPDDDFQYFNIYRSSDPNFVPSPSELVHSATETNWADPEYDGWPVYYKVTALDFVENESDPAGAETVTAVAEPVIPQTYGLYPNVPNPFNPTTAIRYDVPAGGGVVTLQIYNVSGALIRTLLDGPQTAGQKTITWNGRDNRGRDVASGVYFYRMTGPGFADTRKMVLLQ